MALIKRPDRGSTKVFYRPTRLETHALSAIQLDINQGEYVSIAGPSVMPAIVETLLSILGLLAGHPRREGSYRLRSVSRRWTNLKLSCGTRQRFCNKESGVHFLRHLIYDRRFSLSMRM